MNIDDLKRGVTEKLGYDLYSFNRRLGAIDAINYLHAQGRIVPDGYMVIPKLVDGWEIFCLGRYNDWKFGYWLEVTHMESGKKSKDFGIPVVYGPTIEDVFSRANKKIAYAQKEDE